MSRCGVGIFPINAPWVHVDPRALSSTMSNAGFFFLIRSTRTGKYNKAKTREKYLGHSDEFLCLRG